MNKRAIRTKIRALRRLSADGSNANESELAAERANQIAERYGISDAQLNQPETVADLTKEQREAINERFAAELARRLIRRVRRGGLITKEEAEKELQKLAAVPSVTDEDRILFQTQGGGMRMDELRLIIHEEERKMLDEDGVYYTGLAERVCARLKNDTDRKRARRMVAGLMGSLARRYRAYRW